MLKPTIYKYLVPTEFLKSVKENPVKGDVRHTLEVPRGSVPLSVAEKYGELCIWAKVDRNQVLSQKIEILLIGTGNDFNGGDSHLFQFLGTVVTGKEKWYLDARAAPPNPTGIIIKSASYAWEQRHVIHVFWRHA